MEKKLDQTTLEAIVIRTLDFFESVDFSLAEWEKENEEDPETIPTKGTRHHSTRQERRKKTAHAKVRKVEVVRTREARKYPYSLMLGKGKKHDHVWIGEASITEIRLKSRYQSELRDYHSRDLRFEDFLDNYVEDGEDEWVYIHDLQNEISKRDQYIEFLESRIRDLEREIGF